MPWPNPAKRSAQQVGELVEGAAGHEGVEHLVGEDGGQVVPAVVADQLPQRGPTSVQP
jgi:hypothetical protein